ncbi:MAG: hypothetical protein COT25_02385 [Candidatus Kerfeldbacteria bacterium CG08_land_8_20_14_0_20_42_7]|uniref:AAA+ ATPase domain-containing protein n=1 Tax=Candidatus Kerfeldbacteria bacterium CG08_land_8_20_14_0_20_42_7 TaxID=2014245 RepID=A0A2H0YV03_9BACT|nr:MAG: hypothetical protein COT25_02385 [Candidatus Kerfeldbacteria bacterium CG08_land_8_20_14_0_20_42_7]
MKDEALANILQSSGLIDETALQEAKTKAQEKKVSLIKHLLDENVVTESILYEAIAHFFNHEFVDLRKQTIRKDILNTLPEAMAQAQQVIVFDKSKEGIKIATTQPDNLQVFEFIRKKTDLPLQIFVTTPSSLKEAVNQYHKGLSAEFKEITADKPEDSREDAKPDDEKDLKDLAQDLPIVRIVDSILEYAIFENASDIHIEPSDKEVIVRYRIDGRLKEVMRLPKKVASGIIARIKILSSLKIDEHRLPQDGRFKISTKDYKVAFRVSILPVFDGEKAVLRLLDEGAQVLTLEQLGLQEKPLEILKRNFTKPHGMILVTGPTGSGKTTTLYTVLNILNKPEVNISTVEDPVEYRMPRINQSQVNPKIGFTFASGLRSLLRQDPNIIMVGEIRDNETAEIAANAAMTGHLVLSTLHTNDAVTALPRLAEMDVPSFLIASTTNIIMAQRLVRKICLHCIQSYTLNKSAVQELEKHFDLHSILETLVKAKIIMDSKTPVDSLLFYRGKGCKQCGNSGYKGRIGIYEILEITHDVAQAIMSNENAEDLRKRAKDQGMMTMVQDGFIKAKNGVTTLEEILRVTQE